MILIINETDIFHHHPPENNLKNITPNWHHHHNTCNLNLSEEKNDWSIIKQEKIWNSSLIKMNELKCITDIR